jgi:hypothetical protein
MSYDFILSDTIIFMAFNSCSELLHPIFGAIILVLAVYVLVDE